MRPVTRLRLSSVGVLVAALAVALSTVLSLGVAPASADPDVDSIPEARARLAALPDIPLVSSSNVKHLSANPSSDRHLRLLPAQRPAVRQSGLDSLRVYDVRDGAHPS